MQSVIIDSPHGPYHYEIPDENNSGLKPVVFFLHGGSPKSQHTKFWTPLLDIIEAVCYPVLIDRFGHGLSTGKGGLAANDEMLSSLLDIFVPNTPSGKVYLVGRSAGAVFCIRQWQSRSADIAGLGLIAPGSLKSYASKLQGFSGKMSLLWDIDDPVVKFENYQLLKEAVSKYSLFTIGENGDAVQSESREIRRSHTPELKAPNLFEAFLNNLLE